MSKQKTTPKQYSEADWYNLIQKIVDEKDLSESELEFFARNRPNIDNERLKELIAKSKAKRPDGSTEPLSQEERDDLYNLLGTSTQVSEAGSFLDKAQDTAKTKLGEKVANTLSLALAGGDIVGSTQQIKTARQLARQSRRPQRPTPLTSDPLLSQAIREAQQGKFDAARRLAPAQLAILDQYVSDINQAKTASTGQAGTYGALAQVASTRRSRGNQQLAPVLDDMRAREQERLDNLVRLKIGENLAIQQSQAAGYGTDMEAYLQEQEAIGKLGATGRQGLREGLVNFGSRIVDPIAQAATQKRFDRLRATMGQYPEAAETRIQAETDLNNAHNGERMYFDPVTGVPVQMLNKRY